MAITPFNPHGDHRLVSTVLVSALPSRLPDDPACENRYKIYMLPEDSTEHFVSVEMKLKKEGDPEGLVEWEHLHPSTSTLALESWSYQAINLSVAEVARLIVEDDFDNYIMAEDGSGYRHWT